MLFLWKILPIIFILVALVGVLIFTAAFTLVERKLMGLYQRREGPDRVGFEGVGQPFADGLKLLRKEIILPKDSPEQRVFFIAPIISLWVSFILWAFIPFSPIGSFFHEEVGLVLVLGFSSLGSYGIIYAGWASNNKYALLGAFRAVAQFISYEILFSLIFLPIVATTSSTNLVTIASFQEEHGWFIYLVPLWLLAFIVILAETNRTPFDLPEAEAELVAGFNVEYSSLLFAFFFLAEYSSMGFFAALIVTLFFGGWSTNPFGKVLNKETEIYVTSLYQTKKKLAKNSKFSSVSVKQLPLNLAAKQPTRTIKYRSQDEYAVHRQEFRKTQDEASQPLVKSSLGGFKKKEKFTESKDMLTSKELDFMIPADWRLSVGEPTNDLPATTLLPHGFDNYVAAKRFDLREPNYFFHYRNRDVTDEMLIGWNKLMLAGNLNPLKHSVMELIFSQMFCVCIVAIKIQIFCTFFIFVRASLPRKRFDQLIQLCWKYFFPLVLSFVLFSISVHYSSVLYHLSENPECSKKAVRFRILSQFQKLYAQ